MTASPRKIPATVVTGFLGAGKTTVIRNMLARANGRRIALIVNEFGDIGIDREVLLGCGDEACTEDDVVELSNGCICCTVADDFIPTMKLLIERDSPPDHIVIETSGLALPQPLVKAFNWPEIRSRVTVDGVVTVVDGAAVAEGRFASDEEAVNRQRAADEALDHESPLEELFEDQLACADMILLNKADLLDTEAMEKVSGEIAGQARPGVKVLASRNGEVDPAVLLGLSARAEDDMAARRSHHEMEGEEDHDHDDFESFSIELGAVANRQRLIDRIVETIALHDVLRLKGFIAVEGADARLVVQAVGPRVTHYFDRPWRPGEARRSRLVVIGERGLPESDIRAAING